MKSTDTDFEQNYRAQLTELAGSIVNYKRKGSQYIHPAFKSIEEAIKQSDEYAEMVYKYISIAYKSGLPKNIEAKIKSYIKLLEDVAQQEPEIDNEQSLQMNFTHPESMRHSIKMWQRLEIISREIFAFAKLTGLNELTKMHIPHKVVIYMTTESIAKAQGKQIPPTERIFPDLKEDLSGYRTSVFKEVVEVVRVTILPTELRIAKNLISERAMELQEVEMKKTTQYIPPQPQQQKIRELA
jgi:hypothetical protein